MLSDATLNTLAKSFGGGDTRSPSGPRGNQRPRVVMRPGQHVLQLVRVRDVRDERFGKPEYDYMRIRFTFVALIPGAAEATGEAYAKFLARGHGQAFAYDVHPICSPPRRTRTGEMTRPSLLYEVLRIVANYGQPLSPYHLGTDPDTAHLPPEQRMAVVAERIASLLSSLEQERPQVYGMIETRETAAGGKTSRLTKIIERVPEEELLPPWDDRWE